MAYTSTRGMSALQEALERTYCRGQLLDVGKLSGHPHEVATTVSQGNVGVAQMKAQAQSFFWWPGLDGQLKECALSCTACQAVKNAPPVAPLHPWLWPAKPWQWVHLNFAGPYGDRMLILSGLKW